MPVAGCRLLLAMAAGAVLVAPACRRNAPSALEAASQTLSDNPQAEVPPPPPTAARAHPSKRPADARGAPATRPVAGQALSAVSTGSPTPGSPTQKAPPQKTEPTPSGPFETAHVDFDGQRILLKTRIAFDGSHAFVADQSHAVLDDLVKLMTQRPQIAKVEIQAHRHSRMKSDGTVTQKRADAVRNYLVRNGIEVGRLVAVGYEDQIPIDTNRTEDGRLANTRVELHVRELR